MRADQHPSPDDLVLLAIGETVDPELLDHVSGCAACTAEIESWQFTADVARQAELAGWLPDAPGRIWRSVVAELGLAVDDPVAARPAEPTGADQAAGRRPEPTGSSGSATARLVAPDGAVSADGPVSADGVVAPDGVVSSRGAVSADSEVSAGAAPAQAAGRVDSDPTPMDPTPIHRPSSPRRWVLLAAAAVVGAVVGGGAVYAWQNQGPSTTVERTAQLLGLPDGQPQVAPDQRIGDAQLLAVRGGQELKVQVQALPPIVGAYEVWLIAGDQKMVSLGVLAGDDGTFTVPAGIDTAEYKVVDISNEPLDGNPTHSKNSIARGSLS